MQIKGTAMIAAIVIERNYTSIPSSPSIARLRLRPCSLR